MALFDTIRAGAAGAGGDYEVERSIRLNRSDNSYLEINRSSDGNRKKWTFSTWLKVAKHGNDLRPVFAFNGTGNNRENFAFESNGKLAYQLRVSGSSKAQIVTNFQFRDPTAWYHIVLIWDSDNSTSADRAIIYVNGVRQEVTTFITPVSGSSTFINAGGVTHFINHDAHWAAGDYSYAETYFIDGQAYDPTYFAESHVETGQWVPKKYTSGFSGNSFYLAYTDNSGNSATTIGKDYSGLGNNVTPQGVSVAAWPDNDSLVDTPTNNFATLNPLDANGNVGTANANLETSSSTGGNHFPIFTSMSMRGGKYYMEYKCLNGDNGMIMSIMNIEHDGGSLATDSTPGNNASAVNKVGFGLLVGSGRTSHNGTLSSPGAYGSALAVNEAETGMCAVDLDNGKIWWGKEGTFFNSGDPANGTNAAFTTIDTDTTWNFCFHVLNNNNLALNWGQHGYSFTPPTGFGRLCTADLAEPEIKNPTAHHETILYSGNGSQRAIGGLDFSPDLVWVKRRNAGNFHILSNVVSGSGVYLVTNTTDAESTGGSQLINGFNSDGFDVGTEAAVNNSSGTYASWNWNGGDSTVTNTSGSRTTQVRANQTCGFSILTFNYGSGSQTLGHGLGKPPQWIMGKTQDNSTAWVIFHKSTGANKWFNYNTSPANNGNAVWDNAMPTSTLINLGTGMSNQGDAIFFAWSEIVGFSAFGKYVGNGSTNGPYVHTGFQPAWLMYKNVSQNGGQWFIRDNKRQTGNPNNASLAAESSGSETESSLVDTDFLSNGFKLRETNEGTNNNGIEYIFMAFAKHPVKYTRAV